MTAQGELQVQETGKVEVAQSDAERTRERIAFVPRVDIYETEEAIVVLADMPGVDEQTVEVTLEKDVLTINGYVEPESYQGYSLAYAEYRVGDYQRRFTIPAEINRDGIEAAVKDGVLRLHLPKATPAAHKIAVKAG